MIILGIETSCDETSVGVVDGDGFALANVVATQVDVHARYGGIVPEVASRQHILDIRPVCEQAILESGIDWSDIDAVGVTYGPGLAGSLITGLNLSKALSSAIGVPLIGVNHLEGHVYGAWIRTQKNDLQTFQHYVGEKLIMCLIVSGGHTELVLLEDHGRFRLLGETRDDAAGEAFDKAARVLGLRYPGGPEIQRVAQNAPTIESLPRAWMKGTDDFSFSGLKTATLNRARSLGIYPQGNSLKEVDDTIIAGLAKAFQDSAVDVLVTKTVEAAVRENCCL